MLELGFRVRLGIRGRVRGYRLGVRGYGYGLVSLWFKIMVRN